VQRVPPHSSARSAPTTAASHSGRRRLRNCLKTLKLAYLRPVRPPSVDAHVVASRNLSENAVSDPAYEANYRTGLQSGVGDRHRRAPRGGPPGRADRLVNGGWGDGRVRRPRRAPLVRHGLAGDGTEIAGTGRWHRNRPTADGWDRRGAFDPAVGTAVAGSDAAGMMAMGFRQPAAVTQAPTTTATSKAGAGRGVIFSRWPPRGTVRSVGAGGR
jgi:hypothetical protein